MQAFQRELDNAQSMMSVLRDRSSSDSTKDKSIDLALAALDLYKVAASKLVVFGQRTQSSCAGHGQD